MKKQLLAVAVLGACAAPVFSADTVVIYGLVDVPFAYGRVANAGSDPSVRQVTVGNSEIGNRLGFRGEEDLGNGLKASFQIETSLRLDDATSGAFASREGWVRLHGPFGVLGIGRGKTPYTNLNDIADVPLGASINGSGGLNINTDFNGVGGFSTSRFNNAIRWDSLVYSGFSGAVMYGAGENKTADTPASGATPAKSGVDSTQNWSLAAKYDGGASLPLFVGIAYNNEKNPGATPVDGARNTGVLVYGQYKLMDALTLGVGYQNSQIDTTTLKRKRNTYSTLVLYSLTPELTLKGGGIWGGKAKYDNKNGVSNNVDGTDFVRYYIGSEYALSKRTSLYAEYNGENFKKDGSGSNIKQVGNTFVTTLDRRDVDVISVGILHRF